MAGAQAEVSLKNHLGFKAKPAKGYEVGAKLTQFMEGFKSADERYVTLDPAYSAAKWLKLGAELRHVFGGAENRLSLVPVLKAKLGSYSFDDRNKIEYRMRDKKGNSFRYRNRLKVTRNLAVSGFEFAPFASDEIFYDFSKSEFSRNEFVIGAKTKVAKQISLSVYYLLQSAIQKSWDSTHFIGAGIDVAI